MKRLLLSRLADYSRELSFWRDSLRKALGPSPDGTRRAESVIDAITDNLKTYGTREHSPRDFRTLEVLSDLIDETANATYDSDPPKDA